MAPPADLFPQRCPLRDGAAATSAAIFWLKARAGWREKDIHEITGPSGGPVQMVDVSGLSDAQLAALEPILARLATRSVEGR